MEKGPITPMMTFIMQFVPGLLLVLITLGYYVVACMVTEFALSCFVFSLPYMTLFFIPAILSILYFFGKFRRHVSIVNFVYGLCGFAILAYVSIMSGQVTLEAFMIYIIFIVLVAGGLSGVVLNTPENAKKLQGKRAKATKP